MKKTFITMAITFMDGHLIVKPGGNGTSSQQTLGVAFIYKY